MLGRRSWRCAAGSAADRSRASFRPARACRCRRPAARARCRGPTSRGSRYCSCASSTCDLPFARPRPPREDVEDELRAIDDAQPSASSIWRSWAGVSSWSKTTRSTPLLVARQRPAPEACRARGTWPDRAAARSCIIRSDDARRRPPRRGPPSSSSDCSASCAPRLVRRESDQGGAFVGVQDVTPVRARSTAGILARAPTAPRPRESARGTAPRTSTMVDGAPAGRRPGVDQPVEHRCRAPPRTASGSLRRRARRTGWRSSR